MAHDLVSYCLRGSLQKTEDNKSRPFCKIGLNGQVSKWGSVLLYISSSTVFPKTTRFKKQNPKWFTFGKPWLSSSSVDESPAAAVSSVKSVFSRKAVVRMQLLKEVVGSDSYRVNNKYDHNHTPLPICEIIQRAQVLIGQEVSYDLLGSNCEHFVTLLRYGEGVSEQVSHFILFLSHVSPGQHIIKIWTVSMHTFDCHCVADICCSMV